MINKKELSKNGNMEFEIIEQPAIEPITVNELKLFARIDGDEEDLLLESFLKTARELTEFYLRRKLITQKIKAIMDFWPAEQVELPYPPLISVEEIRVYEEDGTSEVINTSEYYIITESAPGKIVLKTEVTMPTTTRTVGAYQIKYTCGYGSAASDIPNAIKNAIKMWATVMYEKRAWTDEPPIEVQTALRLYKIMRI